MNTFTFCGSIALTIALAVPAPIRTAQTRDGGTVVASDAADITGTVVSSETTPRPLRRAIVTVSGRELGASRSAITDDDGRFSLRNLPPGRVTITATKRGYVAGAYGAARPGRDGTPVELTTGQSLDATIRLARSAVLTGTIRDERGDPVAGLRVFAIDARRPAAPEPGGDSGALTDDRGVYRLYDLVPGTYVVAATSTEAVTGEIKKRSVTETDAMLSQLRARTQSSNGISSSATPIPDAATPASQAVMFFPGTPATADATRIELAPGDVRDGLDFVMAAVPVATIEGAIVSAEGPLPASIQMSIEPANTVRFFALAGANPQLAQAPGADGTFKYSTISPGHYVITARGNRTAPPSPVSLRGVAGGGAGPIGSFAAGRGSATAETTYAVAEVDVAGFPVRGVTLQLQRGSRFSGRVTFDASGTPAPTDLTTVRVGLERVGSANGSSVGGTSLGSAFEQLPPVTARADGTFEFVGLPPGTYRAQVTVGLSFGVNWWFRSADVAGHDVLDAPLEIALGKDVTDAVLTMTDRHGDVAGTLQSAAGVPAPEYFVVIFPVDPALRTSGSRRVKSTRPATNGTFGFTDLPGGDYLLAALTDADPSDLEKPEFFQAIAPSGVKVTIVEGQKAVRDLRIGGR